MWYAIQIQTGHEEQIIQVCKERVMLSDEKVFTFYCELDRKYHGEWETVTFRQFPGYVFFESGRVEDLHMRLKNVPEMTKIIRFDDVFIPVAPEEQDFLERLGGEDHLVKTSVGIIVDGELIVHSGPLAGFEDRVIKIDRHKRHAIIRAEINYRQIDMKVGLQVTQKVGISRQERLARLETAPQ